MRIAAGLACCTLTSLFLTDWRPRPVNAVPPLYDPRFEHDACGVGFIAATAGRPGDTHLIAHISTFLASSPRAVSAATPPTDRLLWPLRSAFVGHSAVQARRDAQRCSMTSTAQVPGASAS